MSGKKEAGEAKKFTEKAIELNSLAVYQEGAVISVEIAQGKTGTVTFFSFDKGQGLSEHTAPFDALVQVTDGEALIVIAGRENTVKSGEFIIMPANKPHALKANNKFKMLLTMIRS
ncbi:MAG: cupin domain-containing protein [Candidatus Margulisiibacteriota bacterium]